MPKRTIINARTKQVTVEDFTLTAEEQAAATAQAARKAAQAAERQALVDARSALDAMPFPANVAIVIDKMVEVITYLRAKFPEDVR